MEIITGGNFHHEARDLRDCHRNSPALDLLDLDLPVIDESLENC